MYMRNIINLNQCDLGNKEWKANHFTYSLISLSACHCELPVGWNLIYHLLRLGNFLKGKSLMGTSLSVIPAAKPIHIFILSSNGIWTQSPGEGGASSRVTTLQRVKISAFNNFFQNF